ncbi:neuronal membrane glycoprotein M6-a-like isoform X2 [Ornithodoros turicata]
MKMGCCSRVPRCLSRVPFATLIATVMFCAGVAIFLGSTQRAAASTLRIVDLLLPTVVTSGSRPRPRYGADEVRAGLVGGGVTMGVLGLALLVIACLATGPTRERLGWRARAGSRFCCALLMGLAYVALLGWIALSACAGLAATLCWLAGGMCSQMRDETACVDLRQFEFLLPTDGTTQSQLVLCGGRRKEFCKDHVEGSTVLWILGAASGVLVVLSLVHHLMCLAANYAHIKDQQKMGDLQLLHDLQETEMAALGPASKDRF